MAVSSSSMKVASVTVMAISHGLTPLVRSVLVERTAVAAAILASSSTQMADETERSQNKKEYRGSCWSNGDENASWLENSLSRSSRLSARADRTGNREQRGLTINGLYLCEAAIHK